MNTRLGIYCPSYRRPHELKRLVKDLKKHTRAEFDLVFCFEKGDDTYNYKNLKELEDKYGVTWRVNKYEASYSNALQDIYEHTDHEFFLWANDDFYFTDGWDVEPLKMFENDDISVLGLHDGNPDTRYFSISMVRRRYIEEQSGVIDIPNRVLYPYKHNYVDDELTLTAQKRGVWAYCPGERIIHKHHSFTWLKDHPEVDETYAKNEKTFGEDTQTFLNRRYLFD